MASIERSISSGNLRENIITIGKSTEKIFEKSLDVFCLLH